MQFKLKFMVAVVAGMLCAIPGTVSAQNADQNPPAQDQQDQMSGQDLPQDQQVQQDGRDMSQDQDQAPLPDRRDSTQQGETEREPMSELPPKPSPNLQGRRPYGPNYGNPGAAYPDSEDTNSENGGAAKETPENNAVARLSLIHGDVSTQRGDSGDWSAAQVNAPVMAGDKVSTGDKARTELQLDFANILRLSEHTQANISNLTRSQIQLQLAHGMANYTVLGNSDADAEIDTPNVSIRTERQRRVSAF